MAKTQDTIAITSNLKDTTLRHAVRKLGYQPANFKNQKFKIQSQGIYHTIKQNLDYTTFYKVSTGGSVLILEFRIHTKLFELNSYSPISLFGMKQINLGCDKNIFRLPYLKTIYRDKELLLAFVRKLNN